MDGSKKRVFHIIMPSLIQYSDWIIILRKLLHELLNEKPIRVIKKCDHDELRNEQRIVKEAMDYEEPVEELTEDDI